MDTLLTPGLSTYATTYGHDYRISGIVNGTANSQSVQNALSIAGFNSLVYSEPPSPAPSASWPTEDLPALSQGERYFRAEGIWMQTTALPTAITLTNGTSIVLTQVWDHIPDVTPITLTSANEIPSPALPQSEGGGWWLFGGILTLAAAASVVVLAMNGTAHGGHGEARENPLYRENMVRKVNGRWAFVSRHTGRPLAYWTGRGKPPQSWVNKQERRVQFYKRLPNPVRYDSSFTVHGVPVHVHLHDGRYCADYRAVDRFAPGKGAVTCASTKEEAEDQARMAVTAALVQARRAVGTSRSKVPQKPRQRVYPTPWD
jgi:hypothetical protein